MKMPNNEIINNFWQNIPLSIMYPDEITNMIKKLKSIKESISVSESNNANHKEENFTNELEKILIEVFFKPNINENTDSEIMEYLKQQYFPISTPNKILMVFFCVYLLSNCPSEHNFRENFLSFYEICNKNMQLDLLDLKLNDKNLIKEFVIFYVYLISIGTVKGFKFINNKNKVDVCYKDLENIYNQNNRDLFIEDLFFIYEKVEFNFNSFFIHNFYKLNHERVRHSLKDIEMRNNIISNQDLN
jgi:hypothetical protein